MLAPKDIALTAVEISVKKAQLSALQQFGLGVMAGAFIAFGAQAASFATHTITDIATAKLIAGIIFPSGLILVLLAGAELFTGNCLMVIALAQRKISLVQLLRSWLVVYLGNLAGSILVAYLVWASGQLNSSDGLLGAITIKAATAKISLSFTSAIVLGVLCNWLVCLAVWTSFSAQDPINKAVCAFFPVWLFVASGFEHSIANMYYIPAGILAKSAFSAKALTLGLSQDTIDALNWASMFTRNIFPVTLGNILGGAGLVGIVYWCIFLKEKRS